MGFGNMVVNPLLLTPVLIAVEPDLLALPMNVKNLMRYVLM